VTQACQKLQTSTRATDSRYIRDERLVTAAQAGSQSAFLELYNSYSPCLFRAIFRITKNREDAEDALQDCFLQAFRSLSEFQGRAAFGTWIWRIAINSSLMLLRRKKHRPETSLFAVVPGSGELLAVEVKDDRANPEQRFEHRQRISHLKLAMKRMTPVMRDVVELRVLHECTVREAARILNISQAAVKARLFRARSVLRESHERRASGKGQLKRAYSGA
jgi:RNA polymerase sigma factor (sigma-70 family)